MASTHTKSGDGRLRKWLSPFLPSRTTTGQLSSQTVNIDLDYSTDHQQQTQAVSRHVNTAVTIPPPLALKDDSNADTDVIEQQTVRPSNSELDRIEWGRKLSGPRNRSSPTPSELEENNTPDNQRLVTPIVPSVTEPYMNRWRCSAACLAFFIQGLNDSAPGALLPYMERYYSISYALVSLIFVSNAIGFIAAAPFCHKLNGRFGRAKVLSSCTVVNVLAYIATVCQPPFAVIVVVFLIQGFCFATILSLDNVFIINLRNGTPLLGYMHGFYGVGGIVAPFVATAMVSNGIRWSLFYLIPMALSLVNSGTFMWSFQSFETEAATIHTEATLERNVSQQSTRQQKNSILRKSLKNRTTLLGALLIFAYQGAEVSISGWVISFLIDYRNGNPAHVGYVTSGFWGGITLGRFLLVAPAHKIGDRISLIILVAGTAAFQFIVWFLPNVIGNAVAVAIIGVLLGPIYPCATGVFSKLLPSELQITSLGFISSMGSSGGAIAPFFTGLLAQKLGTVVLNPICIALCVVMEVAWLALPRVTKRTE